MKSHSPPLSAVEPSPLLLGSLYVLEFCVLLTAMAVYKKGDRSLLVFLSTPFGFASLIAVFGLVISTLVIIHLLRQDCQPRTNRFSATLVLNLCSVALVFATAEVVIRVFAINRVADLTFANMLLLPRSWENVATRNRFILAKASTQGSYLVYDKELGWTIGASRRSLDYNREYVRQILSRRQSRVSPAVADYAEKLGRVRSDSEDDIYLSSVEGIRSPRVGMSFSAAPARHRIAIVGDSFTFGLEVRYDETWGHQVELALGQGYQVLNFGVDGYGVDQAYLRYQRDVLSWHPDIVILGVINDDLRRTMGVYGFLNFPGGEIPFPKPRFVVGEHGLVPLNLPLPTPESLFAKQSITELPFVEYDGSFQRTEWESRFYHYLYSVRLLLSKYPRWPEPRPSVSDEALKSVNGEIFRLFVTLARERGSTPIVVYFPSKSDFDSERTAQAWPGMAREVLRANGIPYLDMTDCVSKVNPAERFVTQHYSPTTNAAIARCLRESLREFLRL